MTQADRSRADISRSGRNSPGSRRILHIHFHINDGSNPELYGRLVEQLQGISPRTQVVPPDAADCDVTG